MAHRQVRPCKPPGACLGNARDPPYAAASTITTISERAEKTIETPLPPKWRILRGVALSARLGPYNEAFLPTGVDHESTAGPANRDRLATPALFICSGFLPS